MTAVVLAHQGGWDEAAMVLVPLAFFALLLRVAHVRAGRLDDVDADTADPAAGSEHQSSDLDGS